MTMPGDVLRPVFQELTARYRTALEAYREEGVASTARAFAISEREYCDLFIALLCPPITWASSSTDSQGLTAEDYDAAHEEARRQLAIAS